MNKFSLSLWEDSNCSIPQKAEGQQQTLINTSNSITQKPQSILIHNRPAFKFVKVKKANRKLQISKRKSVNQKINRGPLQPKNKPVKAEQYAVVGVSKQKYQTQKAPAFIANSQKILMNSFSGNLIRVEKRIGGEMLVQFWENTGKYFNREMQRNLKQRYIQLKGHPMDEKELERRMLSLLGSIESGSRSIRIQNYLI